MFSHNGLILQVINDIGDIDYFDLIPRVKENGDISIQVPFRRLASSPDGRTLVFGGADGSITMLDD
jgi:hypothetical protein